MKGQPVTPHFPKPKEQRAPAVSGLKLHEARRRSFIASFLRRHRVDREPPTPPWTSSSVSVTALASSAATVNRYERLHRKGGKGSAQEPIPASLTRPILRIYLI